MLKVLATALFLFACAAASAQTAQRDLDRLTTAINEGRYEEVEKMLSADPKLVNARDKNSYFIPLLEAVNTDHIEIVRLLLDRGADINARDYGPRTALMIAADHCNADMVKLLLERGADTSPKGYCSYGKPWNAAQCAAGHAGAVTCMDVARLIQEHEASAKTVPRPTVPQMALKPSPAPARALTQAELAPPPPVSLAAQAAAAQHETAGVEFYRWGRLADAEREFREQVRLEPDSAAAHRNLGASLSAQHKYAEAEAEYRVALRRQPDDPGMLNSLGYVLAERGEGLDEAVELLRRAVAAKPQEGNYLDSLGWAYFKKGQLEEAERYIREAVKLAGDNPEAREHLGDVLRARGKAEEAQAEWGRGAALYDPHTERYKRLEVKRFPDDPVAYVALGDILRWQDRYAEAEAVYSQAIGLSRDKSDERVSFAQAADGLGSVLVERGERLDEAVELLRRAVEFDEWDADYLHDLGWAYFKKGQVEVAEKYLSQALRYADWRTQIREPLILEHLGDVLRTRGKVSEARAEWLRAIHLSPTDDETVSRLRAKIIAAGGPAPPPAPTVAANAAAPSTEPARVSPAGEKAYEAGKEFYRQGKLADAEREFREFLRLEPDNGYGYVDLAATLIALQKNAEAEAVYRRAIGLTYPPAEAYGNLGSMLLERGEKLDEAVGLLRRAAAAGSSNDDYLRDLGWAYYKKGEFDLAEKYLRQAVQVGTDDDVAHQHLGDALQARGKAEEARAEWELARKALALEGTTWSDTDGGALYRFRKDGAVSVSVLNHEDLKGTWKQQGDSVEVRLSDGAQMRARIARGRMRGTYIFKDGREVPVSAGRL